VSALFTRASAARMPTPVRRTAQCFHAASAAGTLRLDMLPVTSVLKSIGNCDGSSAVAIHASQISHRGSTAASIFPGGAKRRGMKGHGALRLTLFTQSP